MTSTTEIPKTLVGLLLATLASCDAQRTEPASDLRIVYTASLNGYIEPCGCVVGKTGGIDRIAAAIEGHRQDHSNVLFLDAGDLLAEDPAPPPKLKAQLALKADAMLGVWKELGLRALGLGDLDLVIGIDELQRLADRHDLPILCGNIVDSDGERPFPGFVEFEQAGQRVAVLSLLGPELSAAGKKDSRTFDVAATVADLGYELTDWRVASDEILAEVRDRNDLVIALSHLGAAGTTELAQRHPELDLISGTHVDGFEVPLRFVSDVPITGSTIRGARLNRVDLWFDGRLDAGADDRPWQDVSARQTPEMELATLLRGEQLLIGRELSLGTAEYATRFTGQANTKAAVLDALRSREPLPSGRKIAVVGDALPMSALRSELALSAIDDYHDAIYDHWMAEEGEVAKHPTDRFVGPKACYECHDVQYEFWKATSHSHAFETLRATRQHVDFECNSCHTVGFAAPAGFRQPNQYPGFENVQCAACHGAGGDHVKGGVSYAQQTFFPLPATACVNCHNDDHHPGFESVYPEKLGIVACPPMGAGNAALNEARLGAATAIDSGAADTTGEPFHRASSIALYLRAGENERAWQSAERWLEEVPNSVEARLWVGELALGRGDVDRAAGLARAVTKRRPNLARGWKLKAATALQSSELEEAATAFREAVSLDNADPEIAIIGARIAQANGELTNAIAILEGYLESSPLAAGVVLPVLEELRAQSDR